MQPGDRVRETDDYAATKTMYRNRPFYGILIRIIHHPAGRWDPEDAPWTEYIVQWDNKKHPSQSIREGDICLDVPEFYG